MGASSFSRFLGIFLAVHCLYPEAVVGVAPTELLSANVSGSVTLSCAQRNADGGRVRWYHEGAARYLTLNRAVQAGLPADLARRLEVVGDPLLGRFDLRLDDLRRSDSGEYSCLFAPPLDLNRPVALATLTVHVPPDAASARADTSSV